MDERLKYVMNREDMPLKMYSVERILEMNKMGDYLFSCIQRIIMRVEEKPNGIYESEDIVFDIINRDISLTHRGLILCKDILLGYVPEEEFSEILENLEDINHSIENENHLFALFRDMNKKELKKLIKKAISDDLENKQENYEQSRDMVVSWLKAELRSRRISNRIRIVIKGFAARWHVRIKHWRLFRDVLIWKKFNK